MFQVKEHNPSYSICDVAKELGRRWADMDKPTKDRYQARAEEERQKYDVEMAAYRQNTLNSQNAAAAAAAAAAASSSSDGGDTVSTSGGGVAVSHSGTVLSTTSLPSGQTQTVTYVTQPHKVDSGVEYSNLLQ